MCLLPAVFQVQWAQTAGGREGGRRVPPMGAQSVQHPGGIHGHRKHLPLPGMLFLKLTSKNIEKHQKYME